MNFKTIIIFLFLILGLFQNEKACAQSTFSNEIKKSFILGDSKKLASYFDRNVELLLLNKGNVYSKVQAELIMKNFFTKYTAKSFVIESQNKDEASEFTIALLSTKHIDFRVFIACNLGNNKQLINQMIISKLPNSHEKE